MAAREVDGLHRVPLLEAGSEGRQVVVVQRRRPALGLQPPLDPAGRDAGGLVRDRRMERIELVLHEELPVRVLHHAVADRHHLDFADGRAVAHVVEGNAGLAQKLRQRRTFAGQTGEDEAAVTVHPRRRLDAAVRVVAGHPGSLVPLGQRNGAHLAIEVETPGVVGTDEGGAGVAAQVAHQLDAAVRAAVVQDLDAAVALAHHDHRLAPDRHRVVVARRRHLRLVAAVNPGPLPDLFHFGVENRLVRVHALVHAIGVDELLDVHLVLR